MTAKNTQKKNDMTQREWDRIVGWGKMPAKHKETID